MLTRKDQLELKKGIPEEGSCCEELAELAEKEKPKKRSRAKAGAKTKPGPKKLQLSPKMKLSPLARATKLKMQDTRYYEPRGSQEPEFEEIGSKRGRGHGRGRGRSQTKRQARKGSDAVEASSPEEVDHHDPVRRRLFVEEGEGDPMAEHPHHILDPLVAKMKAKEAKAKAAKPRAKAKAKAEASAASGSTRQKRVRNASAEARPKAQAKRASSRPQRVDDAVTQEHLRDEGILRDFAGRLKSEAADPSVPLEDLKVMLASDLKWFPRTRVMPYWNRPAAAVKWVADGDSRQIAYFPEIGQTEKGKELNRRLIVQIFAARLFVALA